MGSGYMYKCRKCKNEYTVRLGGGMSFPAVYRQVLNDIKSGVYGDELGELANSHQYTAVNAIRWVYICNHCGNWKSDYILDLYVPTDIEKIAKTKYGVKTVDEWGYVPYVMPYSLRANYKLLKRFIHKCPDCGKRTHKASEKELQKLPCPNCKTKGNKAAYLNWD